jgi:hypothetical protein
MPKQTLSSLSLSDQGAMMNTATSVSKKPGAMYFVNQAFLKVIVSIYHRGTKAPSWIVMLSGAKDPVTWN